MTAVLVVELVVMKAVAKAAAPLGEALVLVVKVVLVKAAAPQVETLVAMVLVLLLMEVKAAAPAAWPRGGHGIATKSQVMAVKAAAPATVPQVHVAMVLVLVLKPCRCCGSPALSHFTLPIKSCRCVCV